MFPIVGLSADALPQADASFPVLFQNLARIQSILDPGKVLEYLLILSAFDVMLLYLPVPLPDVGYLSASSPDRIAFLSAGW